MARIYEREKDYAQELKHMSSASEEECREYFKRELKDPYVKYDLGKLRGLFDKYLTTSVSGTFLGGLGFLVFTVAAEKVLSEEDAHVDARAVTDFALSQSATIDFIRREYQLDDKIHSSDEIRFHRAGTTSYILRVKDVWRDGHVDGRAAHELKILKFRYIEQNGQCVYTRVPGELRHGLRPHATGICEQ